jgi:hypothetical protein
MVLTKEQLEFLEKIIDEGIASLEEEWDQKLGNRGREPKAAACSNGGSPSFLNDDFLGWLTSIRAQQVYSDTLNPNHEENWLLGEQIAAVQIFDSWRAACKERNKCKHLPEWFYKYLKKIDIQKLKEHRAYSRWKSSEENPENCEADAKRHYYDGCSDIFTLSSICKESENKHKEGECSYTEILALIDRRKQRTDRRQTTNEVEVELRSGSERRKNDINGCLTQYL